VDAGRYRLAGVVLPSLQGAAYAPDRRRVRRRWVLPMQAMGEPT